MINQLKDKNFLIILSISLISFLIAMFFYVREMKSDIEWLTFEKAKVEAATTGKFIYVNVYSRWDANSRLRYNTLFSNENVTEYFQKDFIPVRFNLDDKNEKAALSKDFGISTSRFDFVADNQGRILSFMSTSTSYENFISMLENLEKLKINELQSLENALSASKQSGKYVMLFVSNYLNDNFFIHELMDNDTNFNFAINNHEVAVAMSYDKSDFEKIKFLADATNENDPLKEYQPLSDNMFSDKRTFSTRPILYILNPEGQLFGKFVMEYDLLKPNIFIEKVEQITKKSN
ncbi:MAG: hypothetical protein CVV22_00585 [Ignavibacteriae bacterium HGW-Ignavibacteriae-1]|nr:MAG: hypothetical protein CVV22_00585 [Ignavibacteriae bacterium HGW-Ignavibacteriae-1]